MLELYQKITQKRPMKRQKSTKKELIHLTFNMVQVDIGNTLSSRTYSQNKWTNNDNSSWYYHKQIFKPQRMLKNTILQTDDSESSDQSRTWTIILEYCHSNWEVQEKTQLHIFSFSTFLLPLLITKSTLLLKNIIE